MSIGAARATQMLKVLRHAVGQDEIPVTAAAGLLYSVEDRWRRAAKAAGKDTDLDALRAVDPDLVERESWLLGLALRQVAEELPEDGRALVVGHSPTNEAAVLGLAGHCRPAAGQRRGQPSDGRRGSLPGGATGLTGNVRILATALATPAHTHQFGMRSVVMLAGESPIITAVTRACRYRGSITLCGRPQA